MSDSPSNGQPEKSTSSNGACTLAEVLSQPSCWELALRDDRPAFRTVVRQFASAEEWVFIGCGSSYYVALSAAATMTALTGLRAQAFAASELLIYPDLVLAGRSNWAPVLISRSGQTSEVLRAAEFLRERGVATVGISCAPGQALEKLVTTALVLPEADEQSTVMTRSFTSMLAVLQMVAATLVDKQEFLQTQKGLNHAAQDLLRTLPGRIEEFVIAHDFDDYVCLGQGPLYGIACESALKLTEMSVSYGQSFHTLEFRHGPKAIVTARTLIVFLLSEAGYAAELEVLEEVKRLGGTTLVLANRADHRARAAADLLVELDVDGPETARLPMYVLAGQLMGLFTGIKKGLDPDNPRNLSRVVVLEDEDSPEESAHASI